MAIQTPQSNIKKYNSDFITNYSLFLGGLNATQKSLEQYDPLKTGYARIFFIKMPVFMDHIMPAETKRFRHLLEYGFTRIDGLQNIELQTEELTGGYAGRKFDMASTAQDNTNEITLQLYEFAGSPVREYLDMWISGISDPYTGIGHYHGALDDPTANIKYSQANHVAEAIYVVTDPTGRGNGIEYASLLSNMVPKQVKHDQFNYESGQHQLVQMDIPFTCVQYRSPQINTIAKSLIDRFQMMRDYLDFDSKYRAATGNDVAAGHYKPYIVNWPTQYNAGAHEIPADQQETKV